jgi:hypothetical protein
MFARLNLISLLLLRINHLHQCSTSLSLNLMGQTWCPCSPSTVDLWPIYSMIKTLTSSPAISQSSTETKSARTARTKVNITTSQLSIELLEVTKLRLLTRWLITLLSTKTTSSQVIFSLRTCQFSSKKESIAMSF